MKIVRYETLQHGAFDLDPGCAADLASVLNDFNIPISEVARGGGSKSWMAKVLQEGFAKRGWQTEVRFPVASYAIDCFKSRTVLDIEWNSKNSVFDRDLLAYRALFESGQIDGAVIITRSSTMQSRLQSLTSTSKFGGTTTHMDKLRKSIGKGFAGDCPLIAFGITEDVLVQDQPHISDEYFQF